MAPQSVLLWLWEDRKFQTDTESVSCVCVMWCSTYVIELHANTNWSFTPRLFFFPLLCHFSQWRKALIAFKRIWSVSNRLWMPSDVRHNVVRKMCLCHRGVWWVAFQLCSQCCPSHCACHGMWGCLCFTAASLHLFNYITLICTGTNKQSLIFFCFFLCINWRKTDRKC